MSVKQGILAVLEFSQVDIVLASDAPMYHLRDTMLKSNPGNFGLWSCDGFNFTISEVLEINVTDEITIVIDR